MPKLRVLPVAVILITAGIIVAACDEVERNPLGPTEPPSLSTGTDLPAAADGFIRSYAPDLPDGDDGSLVVRNDVSGENRGLIRFDQGTIGTTVGSNTLDSAVLTFTIEEANVTGSAWVSVHRVTQTWMEDGATWNCADDPTNTSSTECATADDWDMDTQTAWPFVASPSDSASIVSGMVGQALRFVVTADVQDFLAGTSTNHGWVLRLADSQGDPVVHFFSNDAPSGQPALQLFVSTPGITSIVAEQDGFIRSFDPDFPEGESPDFRFRQGPEGSNRSLVQFDQAAIVAALNGQALDSAIVELTTYDATETGTNYLAIHRMTQAWNEASATWNCANDPANPTTTECAPGDVWDMSVTANWPFAAAPTDTVPIQDAVPSGTYRLDVTADVQAFVAGTPNHGWLLAAAPSSTGDLEGNVWSREGVGPSYPAAVAPTLIVYTPAGQDTTVPPPIPAQHAFPPTPLTTVGPVGQMYLRNAVNVYFDSTATGSLVNSFLSDYSGVIIGGIPELEMYIVEIPDPGPSYADLAAIVNSMEGRPGVRAVGFISIGGQVSGRYPTDSSGIADRSAWFAGPNDYTRSRRVIRAPQAWGCETGR